MFSVCKMVRLSRGQRGQFRQGAAARQAGSLPTGPAPWSGWPRAAAQPGPLIAVRLGIGHLDGVAGGGRNGGRAGTRTSRAGTSGREPP